MKFWNAISRDYQQLGKLDSALVNYERSGQIARDVNNLVWQGINPGSMGQVCYLKKEYQRPKSLLAYDYSINKIYEWNIAAYSLQLLAKINLATGKKDSE
jgi:hypothetical protein